jgi:hypothetical protein
MLLIASRISSLVDIGVLLIVRSWCPEICTTRRAQRANLCISRMGS